MKIMKKRFLRALSLVLCGVMLFGAVGCKGTEKKNDNGNGKVKDVDFNGKTPDLDPDFLIKKPEYPEMAKYPEEDKFVRKDGSFDSEGHGKAYNAWSESRASQLNQEYSYTNELGAFFTATSRQFLSNAGTENRVYSPVNVYMALGMLAEITDNDSRKQILDLIGVSNIEWLRAQAKAVWNTNYCDDGAVKSVLASSIWLRNGMNFNKNTINTLADTYYASAYRGEMGSEAFDRAIQSWLNEQTGGLLKEQAGGIKLDPETVIALATTIYYRARWDSEFFEGNNVEKVFHSATGDVKCEFMQQGGGMGTYYYGENFSAVAQSLAYSGDMWFILPDEGTSVDELLSGDAMAAFFAGKEWAQQKSVILNKSIPKFDVCSDISLIDGLKALGIKDVFEMERSDFSPLTSDIKELAVTQAQHAARVAIDEEGCTAAAYTVVMAVCGNAMPVGDTVDFVLDRPFIFVITGQSGLPLFVGVVNQVN